MKNKMRLLLFIFIVSIIGNCYGQISNVDSSMEKIIPPNIEAIAFFKSFDSSVSLSKGTIIVPIPFYSISLKELNINIGLKYNSDGIQVSEIASDVGLGWTMQYGGLVSRQVRDKADDGGSFGYLKNNYYKRLLNKENFDVSELYSAFNTHNELDLIPDRFFFNIGDFSGEFFFDQKTGDILQQSLSDIQIKAVFNDSKIVGWVITDTKGNKYTFGVINQRDRPITSSKEIHNYIGYNPLIRYVDLGISTSFYYDSWYLLKVESYNKEEINYSYQHEMAQYVNKNYDKRVTSSGPQNGATHETSYSDVFEEKYYLKTISFPNGKIEFEKEKTLRKDINGSYALKTIKLFDINNQLVSGYELDYMTVYKDSINDTYKLLPQLDESSKYRMFLKKITVLDKLNKPKNHFVFNYKPGQLPNRFSTAKDIWGYYNGVSNGSTWSLGDNNDNSVSFNKSSIGLLESIEFPTGKIEKFEYESNEVVNSFYNELYNISMPIAKERVSISLGNRPLASFTDRNNCINLNDCLDLIGIRRRPFSIPSNVSDLRYSLSFSRGFQHKDYGPTNCVYTIRILLDGVPIKVGGLDFLFPTTGVQDVGLLSFPKDANGKYKGGDFELEIEGPYGCDTEMYRFASFNMGISWMQDFFHESSRQQLIVGAGNRIKSIKVFSDNVLERTREFSYVNEAGGNSGKLFSPPPFVQKLGTVGHITKMVPFALEESSPLSSFRSQSLGYSDVLEQHSSASGKNGKTHYSFTDMKDGGGAYYEWPFYLPVNNEYRRGLPLETKYYKSVGDNYELERKEKYNYTSTMPSVPPVDLYVRNSFIPAPGHVLPIFKTADFYRNDKRGYRIPLIRFYRNYYDSEIDYRFLLDPLGQIYYKRYYLIGGNYHMTKKEILDFSNGKEINKIEEYVYGEDEHYFITDKITTDHLGDEYKIKYSYINDDDLTTSVMLDNNRKEILSSVEVYKNALLLEKKNYNYKSWVNERGDLEKVENIKNNSTPYVDEKVLFRDIRNNIIELDKGGLKTVYLYGYNKGLLIAIIENASKEEVASSLNTSVSGLSNINENNLIQLDQLRANPILKNSFITTYTYKPLVGITKITDSKGVSNYYEYDSSNRLKAIKDDKGNVLEEYEYNYKQ